MTKVLVTGANGFVGNHLCNCLASSGYQVLGTIRSKPTNPLPANYELRTVGDIGNETNWGPMLQNVDIVVHLAARVHVMEDREVDPLQAFRRVNVYGTEQLLRNELMRNVSRVVYISTVKVHGEKSEKPIFATDELAPADPYAQSKCEAEQLVEKVGTEVGFETAIIRPPLVYGPGVGGNFARLMRMVDRGYPLPFARINNSRSLVGVANLCDLISKCMTSSSASGKKFLVSDNLDLSTPALARQIASAMSRPARLLPIPIVMLKTAAKLVGRAAEASRLLESMQVDIRETRNSLNWTPPVSLADGIQSTADWYQKTLSHG